MEYRLNLSPLTDTSTISDSWFDLWRASSEPFPASHPLWVSTQLQLMPPAAGEPKLAVLTNGRDQLITVLLIDKESATFAVDPAVSDFNDFCAAKDDIESTLPTFINRCFAEGLKKLSFTSLASDSPTIDALKKAAQDNNWNLTATTEDQAPAIPLAGDFDEYLMSLPKKDRHEARRKLRRIANNHDITRETLTTPPTINSAFNDFFELLKGSTPAKKQFFTPQRQSFIKELALKLAEHNLVRLSFLCLDNRRSAGSLCFVGQTTWYIYNSGRDPADREMSNGIVNHLWAVKEACASGIKRYDLMRGAEDYKYRLGGGRAERNLVSIVMEK